jgi:HD-like signal output (HDOD) protein
MNSKAKAFLKSCTPCQPLGVLNNVINAIVENPNTPHTKLTKIISMDLVLSAKILRLANSSSYGNKSEISSLSSAITKVGLKQIRLILKENAESAQFPEELANFITPENFWQRALAVALCATVIDEVLGKKSDGIFSAGLLHDYGHLLILNNANNLPVLRLRKGCKDKKVLIYKNERKVYGFNHMELADALFSEWKIPAVIREAAAYHHSPILAIRYRYETSVVHVADVICSSMQLGKLLEGYTPVLDMDTVSWLGLHEDQLDYICEETVHQLEDRMNLLTQL